MKGRRYSKFYPSCQFNELMRNSQKAVILVVENSVKVSGHVVNKSLFNKANASKFK